MSEQRKAAIRQRADQRIARMELEELMGAETLDQKAVDAKIQQRPRSTRLPFARASNSAWLSRRS